MLKTATPHMSANEAITLILDAAAGVENEAIAEGMALALGAILSFDEIDARVVISNVRSAAIAEREARDYASLVTASSQNAVEVLDETILEHAMEHYPLGCEEDEPAYTAFFNDVYDAVKVLLGATPEAL